MKFIQKNKKNNTDFTEENVLHLLNENGYISTAMIQHKFTVGYADAARMLDTLSEKGYIKHDGQRWVANEKK